MGILIECRGFKLALVADVGSDRYGPYSQQLLKNGAGNSGGGFYFKYEAVFPLFLHVRFQENFASHQGGAMFFGVCNGGVVVDKSVYVGNIAYEGAAIYFFAYNYGVTFAGSSFYVNSAEASGGALFFASGNGMGLFMADNFVRLVGCNVTDNSAGGNSGGIHIFYENVMEFQRCHFARNRALLAGGVMEINDQNVVDFMDCQLHNNSAKEGGALRSKTQNNIFVRDCSISFNTADLNGGGVLSENDTLLYFFGDTILDGNEAGGMGGSVFLFGVTLWSLEDRGSVVFRNSRASHGSALAMVALKQNLSSTLFGEAAELHDISFEDNRAVTAGTVYWYFDPSREEGSLEPAGLHSDTLTWARNFAPYGEQFCTQPVYLDVANNASYDLTLYYTALEQVNEAIVYVIDIYIWNGMEGSCVNVHV